MRKAEQNKIDSDNFKLQMFFEMQREKLEAEVEKLKQENDILTLENCKGSSALDDYRLEIDRLKQESKTAERFLGEAIYENKKLQKENEKLKEALRDFDPIIDNDDTDFAYCKFCRNREGKGHRDDCEYIKLCGDGEADGKT